MESVLSATSCARRRLIRNVLQEMKTIYFILLVAFASSVVGAATDGSITVSATGAFKKPGRYTLPPGKNNIAELIKSAGGLRLAWLYGDFGGVEVREAWDPKTMERGKRKYKIQIYSEKEKAKTEKLLSSLALEDGDVIYIRDLE
jgi:protein involved in polysaccharide export with SLBB domain